MTNTKAFIITGILLGLAILAWVTVETPMAEKYNLSNTILYILCGVLGISGFFIIINQIRKN